MDSCSCPHCSSKHAVCLADSGNSCSITFRQHPTVLVESPTIEAAETWDEPRCNWHHPHVVSDVAAKQSEFVTTIVGYTVMSNATRRKLQDANHKADASLPIYNKRSRSFQAVTSYASRTAYRTVLVRLASDGSNGARLGNTSMRSSHSSTSAARPATAMDKTRRHSQVALQSKRHPKYE